MAHYDVHYTCGHTGTVELFGKDTARNERIEWMERTMICPDCYREEKAKERRIELDNAKNKAQTEQLPTLQGSEKQINWAESIRRKALDKINQTQDLIDKIKGQTLAKWFIDNRSAL